MTNPFDDALRDALRAEAGDATADDDLLRRIQTQAVTAPARRRRALVLVAASVVAILGVGTALLVDRGDDHEGLDVVDVPDQTVPTTPTPTDPEGPTVCTTTSTGAPPCGDAAPQHPALLAFVRDDGWLVTMDLYSGEQHEIYQPFDASADPSPDGAPPIFVNGLELAGDWLYYSMCCEPAVGVIYRVPIAGGTPEHIAYGDNPKVSPDGRYLAATVNGQIWVQRADHLDTEPLAIHDSGFESVRNLSWSQDGRQIAFVENIGEGGQGRVHGLEWNGTDLNPVGPAGPQQHIGFLTRDPDGTVFAWGEDTPAFRSVSQDATGRWLLWNDPDLGLQMQDTRNGERSRILGLPKALAADW